MERFMKPKINPEMIDEENPEWTDDMFAQAKLMTEVDPELVEISKSNWFTSVTLNRVSKKTPSQIEVILI
ncbi:hypothetical protein BGP_1437 [Beggiatoa sp. PS]|nr:hypothetical protein BGP_1437 [Beggiatoa sp. PS]